MLEKQVLLTGTSEAKYLLFIKGRCKIYGMTWPVEEKNLGKSLHVRYEVIPKKPTAPFLFP